MKHAPTRAFLKWAGGKFGLMKEIKAHLPEADVLVEPFVGAGSVFLNTQYSAYHLNDINPDLINLYQLLKSKPDQIIADVERLMQESNNQAERYYALRDEFNQCNDIQRRSALFVYLNRHGYNGLCRYNRKGGYNVPFGRYKRPYFPQKEMWAFAEKAQLATFSCLSYQDVMRNAPANAVIYCDPPYAPISDTAKFTDYARVGFSLDDQHQLAVLAREAAAQGTSVLLSNHDTALTRELYRGAKLTKLHVSRTISRHGASRKKVGELLALYR